MAEDPKQTLTRWRMEAMTWVNNVSILLSILMIILFCGPELRGQEARKAMPGDLIIRHGGKTLGPIGGIPHIGIYVGDKTRDGSPYDVIDLGIENKHGLIGPSKSTDPARFKDPGYYSVLDGKIPVRYLGKIIPLSELPETIKEKVKGKVCEMAEKDIGRNYGKYEFSQFPKGHSVNCGDWVLDLYGRALSSEGIQVMSHKFPGSHGPSGGIGTMGLKPGELRDYAEILWGTTDPSRLPGWLPRVDPPRASAQKVGGVHIDPEPSTAGKGGSKMREGVLKSKPSEDTLSWPVPSLKK